MMIAAYNTFGMFFYYFPKYIIYIFAKICVMRIIININVNVFNDLYSYSHYGYVRVTHKIN